MPTIRITDELGVNLDAEMAPGSSFLKAAGALPALLLEGGNLGQLQILTLNDPAVRSLAPSLSFARPVSLGSGITVTGGADAGFSFRVIPPESKTLFPGDEPADQVEIPAGTCYVALGLQTTAQAGAEAAVGSGTFGVAAQSGIEITSYRPFALGAGALTVTEALRQSIGRFVIPTGAEALEALAAGEIVTVAGRGSLRFQASANLVAVANPLATLALPAGLPSLAISQTGRVALGASWEISGEYQVRARKVDAGHVRLGWYRKRESDFRVTADATAGIDAGAAGGLLAAVIGAISGDAKADREELARASLSASEAEAIEAAVKAAASRKLEVALTAEWGALEENEAAFLYDIDLEAWTDAGKDAIGAALRGNLSGLADPEKLPAGITEARSILSRAREGRVSWKVNLLGIFNAASVSRLALEGTVTFTPSTGELVIADQATASRIQTTAVNFGADEEKLRQVLAESFLITAAYRGSRSLVSPPELASSHMFFRLENNADHGDMRRYAAIGAALGLGVAPLPPEIPNFGRSTVLAEARYTDEKTRALFLNADGSARPLSDYEAAGRRAVALLVLPDGDDAFRLGPATDDRLWNRMKDLGPANFAQLLPATQADGVRPDYLAIQWWAQSMRGAADILAQMAASRPDDPQFQKRRESLAAHLRDVAAKAHEQFGSPWGLVAMFLVSGRKAVAETHITSPRWAWSAETEQAAAGR